MGGFGRAAEVPTAAAVVPELQTVRLRLRGWRDEDLDAFAAMYADPATARFIGGVRDREEAWRAMATFAGHWLLRGYGLWVVESRGDGTPLGRVGLWNPEGWPGIEVGWTLTRAAWGHGYATEAARAAMRWAWTELELPRLISLIDARNAASIRVAERLGMTYAEDWAGSRDPVRIYTVGRPA